MILLYGNIDPAQRAEIHKVLSEMNLPVRDLEDDRGSSSLRQLMELEPGRLENLKSEKTPLMFLGHMDRPTLEKVDARLKEGGITGIHKAVATENNLDWKLDELHREISREAAYFAKREKLYGYIQNLDRQRMQEDPRYFDLMNLSWNLLNQPEASEEALDLALKLLEDEKK